jgi:hypothetical protein
MAHSTGLFLNGCEKVVAKKGPFLADILPGRSLDVATSQLGGWSFEWLVGRHGV